LGFLPPAGCSDSYKIDRRQTQGRVERKCVEHLVDELVGWISCHVAAEVGNARSRGPD